MTIWGLAPIQTEAKIVNDNIAKADTNVKVVINDVVDKTEESAQVPWRNPKS